ncbi:hypothetical protein OAO87_02940 [bacterium]|nr:hypothetical protein [bacterium]
MPPRSGKEKAAPPDDEQREPPESAVASQEGHWRAGVNRQSQPAAHAHQVAASQAAAKKRAENAAPDAQRKAKKAKHMADVREQQAKDPVAEMERKAREANKRKLKRAAQKAARVAAAEAANELTLRKFNTLMLFFLQRLRERLGATMDADEWDAFGEWLEKQRGANEFDKSTCEAFYQAWCDSPEYEAYEMELKYATVIGDACCDPFYEYEGPDEYTVYASQGIEATQRSHASLWLNSCNHRHECSDTCDAPPPAGDPDDPYGGGSADMYYDGPADHERMWSGSRGSRAASSAAWSQSRCAPLRAPSRSKCRWPERTISTVTSWIASAGTRRTHGAPHSTACRQMSCQQAPPRRCQAFSRHSTPCASSRTSASCRRRPTARRRSTARWRTMLRATRNFAGTAPRGTSAPPERS